jgi:Coiled-coil domain-containing protein 55 (DUF2040)
MSAGELGGHEAPAAAAACFMHTCTACGAEIRCACKLASASWNFSAMCLESEVLMRKLLTCRQVKERQVEDHLFGDKEKFVTSAYKKELQERQLWEARQKIK